MHVRIFIFPPGVELSGAEGASSTLTSYSTTFLVYKIIPQSESETSLYAQNRRQRKRKLTVSFGKFGIPSSVEAPLTIVRPGPTI